MKWLGYVVGGLVALAGVAFALAWLLVDAEEVSQAASARLSRTLEQPISIGDVALDLFPVPVIRIDAVSLGASEGRDPFLTAREARLQISLPALFAGRIVLRALELEAPRLALEVGPDGLPRWPDGVPLPVATRVDEEGPGLLITSLRLREGEVTAGPWRIEQLELDGGGNLDLSADFVFSGEVPGVGKVRNGRIELSNLIDGPIRWEASVELADVDLAEVRGRVAPERAIYGKGSATLTASGEGRALGGAELAMALRPLDLRSDAITVNGDVDVAVRTGARWQVDLTGAEVDLARLLTKPLGSPARLSGVTPATLELRRFEDVSVDLEQSRLVASVDLDDPAGAPSLRVSGDLDLAALSGWWRVPGVPERGRVRLDEVRYAPPKILRAQGSVSDVLVRVPFPDEERTLSVSGPVFASGPVVGGRDLSVSLDDQSITLSVAYDLRREIGELVADASGLDLASITNQLYGEVRMKGRLYGRLELSGPPVIEELTGRGRFELPGGEMGHRSLEDFLQQRGQGGAAPEMWAFSRLSGEFDVRDGYAVFSVLDLEQGASVAAFEGSIDLRTGSTDLRGRASMYTSQETIDRFVRVQGPLTGLRADTDVISPEDAQASRKLEKRMLEGFVKAIRDRGVPEDPDEAQMYRSQLDQIERQLKLYEDVESVPFPNEDAGEALQRGVFQRLGEALEGIPPDEEGAPGDVGTGP